MFDKVAIRIEAGRGGDGAISFRHEKYVPYGGPDGGDGGDGGDVIVAVDASMSDLRHYRQNKLYKARNGGNGGGQKKHGKRGDSLLLPVPAGTIVLDSDAATGELLADCSNRGQQEVIARGGRGGLGNVHYASSTNQTPRIAQKGEAGEALMIVLELRLIADIGIIGFPNAGKSTLLASASAARPKIASYPFTTLEPVLGAVETGTESYVWAEIPGLIKDAHAGKGLGHEFLRHVIRTRILVHVIDGTSKTPLEDMLQVNTELELYDPALALKPQVVAVNKIDLPEVKERQEEIKGIFSEAGIQALFISAGTGKGVRGLVSETVKMLKIAQSAAVDGKKAPPAVFRPQPRGSGVNIRKEDGIYIVEAPELERIITRVEMSDPEVRRQLQRPMTRLGVKKALEKAGVKPGDKVRCGGYEWEW